MDGEAAETVASNPRDPPHSSNSPSYASEKPPSTKASFPMLHEPLPDQRTESPQPPGKQTLRSTTHLAQYITWCEHFQVFQQKTFQPKPLPTSSNPLNGYKYIPIVPHLPLLPSITTTVNFKSQPCPTTSTYQAVSDPASPLSSIPSTGNARILTGSGGNIVIRIRGRRMR